MAADSTRIIGSVVVEVGPQTLGAMKDLVAEAKKHNKSLKELVALLHKMSTLDQAATVKITAGPPTKQSNT